MQDGKTKRNVIRYVYKPETQAKTRLIAITNLIHYLLYGSFIRHYHSGQR